MPRPTVLIIATCAVTILCSACDASPKNNTAKDSSKDTAKVAEWTVADKPALLIGAPGGPESNDFGRIRDAAELGNGTIAVADLQANNIRFFTPDGRLTTTVGRPGNGPGEFVDLSSMRAIPGDTLLTYDQSQRRLSWFTAQGFARAAVFEAAKGYHPELYGPFANGRLLQVENPRLSSPPLHPRFGRVNDTVAYVLHRISDDATPKADTIAFVEDSDMVFAEIRKTGTGVPGRFRGAPIFGRTRYTAANENGFAVGKNDSLKIDVYDATGRISHTIRMAITSQPVTPNDVEEYERREAAMETNPKLSGFAELRATVPPAATKPAFSQIMYDAEGNLWVGEYALPRVVPARFMIFDRRGTLIARAAMPRMDRILFIGGNAVLGILRDEDDVEMIARFPIVKPAGRAPSGK